MPKPKPEWVSTTEAAQSLGCSAKYLRSQVGKLFKVGTHYRKLNPSAWRPTYRWNLMELEELMGASDDPASPPGAGKHSRSAQR